MLSANSLGNCIPFFFSFEYMGTHSPYPLGTNQKLINKILLKVNHKSIKDPLSYSLQNIYFWYNKDVERQYRCEGKNEKGTATNSSFFSFEETITDL